MIATGHCSRPGSRDVFQYSPPARAGLPTRSCCTGRREDAHRPRCQDLKLLSETDVLGRSRRGSRSTSSARGGAGVHLDIKHTTELVKPAARQGNDAAESAACARGRSRPSGGPAFGGTPGPSTDATTRRSARFHRNTSRARCRSPGALGEGRHAAADLAADRDQYGRRASDHRPRQLRQRPRGIRLAEHAVATATSSENSGGGFLS